MPALEAYTRKLPYSYAPGLYPAMQALTHQPGSVSRVLIHSQLEMGEGARALLAACERLNIRVETADRALKRISGKENTYAAAVVEKRLPPLSGESRHLVLVNPMDAGNLGTILRTALGFGYVDIAVVTPCADPFDPQVIRASMGAIFQLRLAEYPDFDSYRTQFPGYHLYPFMLTGSKPLQDALSAIRTPYALVFGNEGSGLPEHFAALGTAVRIEQSAAIDSLNLAVAAAVGMYGFSTSMDNRS